MTSFYFLNSRKKFFDTEDAVRAFKNHVLKVSQSESEKCFQNRFEPMFKVNKPCWRMKKILLKNSITIFDDQLAFSLLCQIHGSLRIHYIFMFLSKTCFFNISTTFRKKYVESLVSAVKIGSPLKDMPGEN